MECIAAADLRLNERPYSLMKKIMSLTVDSLDLFHFLCLADVSLGELSDHRVRVASTVMEMNAQSQQLINVTYGYGRIVFSRNIRSVY